MQEGHIKRKESEEGIYRKKAKRVYNEEGGPDGYIMRKESQECI